MCSITGGGERLHNVLRKIGVVRLLYMYMDAVFAILQCKQVLGIETS